MRLFAFILSAIALLTGHTVPATLYETYDDIAVFQTFDGDLWEIHYEGELEPAGAYHLVFHKDQVIDFFYEDYWRQFKKPSAYSLLMNEYAEG